MFGFDTLGKLPFAGGQHGPIEGTVAVAEDDDALSASGRLSIVGTAALVEQDDTLASTGGLPITGAVAVAEDDDTLAAVGIFVVPRFGTVDVTEADDVLDARGALAISATAHLVEDDDTADLRAVLRPALGRYAKARYEAPPLLIAKHSAPPVMKARREPRTFRAQRLAA